MHSTRTYRATVRSDSTSCRRWAQETSFGGRAGEARDDLTAKGLMGVDVKANVGLCKRTRSADLLMPLHRGGIGNPKGVIEMGRQITVELAALEKAGCDIDFESETLESEFTTWDGQDAHCEDIREWVVAYVPGGRRISSNFSHCLSFDCRDMATSTNGWMEKWLIDNSVPYVHG